MSRYALEWAREQQPGDAAAKLVLVLLADQSATEGACRVYDELFLAETGLTAEEFDTAVQRLIEAGLLTAEAWRWSFKRKQTVYGLRIPRGWGSRTSGPPPRRDGSWFDHPTALYRLYDAAGVLLYVGIATSPRQVTRHQDTAQSRPGRTTPPRQRPARHRTLRPARRPLRLPSRLQRGVCRIRQRPLRLHLPPDRGRRAVSGPGGPYETRSEARTDWATVYPRRTGKTRTT